MKGLTTLEKVNLRVDEMFKFCHDKYINVSDISFDSLETMKIGSDRHMLRPVAQRSIAYRLGIPHHYLQKCPQDIQAANMNYWLQFEKQKQLFIRLDGNDIRAIFTPRYIPADHFEILLRLDEMGYGPGTKCQCFHDDQFMQLNIPDGKKTFQINGDAMTLEFRFQTQKWGLRHCLCHYGFIV